MKPIAVFIHIFHSDNALEHLFLKFQHVMTSYGIIDQTPFFVNIVHKNDSFFFLNEVTH